MESVSVILPSLLKKFKDPRQSGRFFVEQAVASIRAQTVANRMTFQIIVGLDVGGQSQVPVGLGDSLRIQFAESNGRSVTAALNAAARQCNGEYVAFLEDDDQWHPLFVETALAVLKQGADFVSSTQLEVTEQGDVVRINDFPTASGWLMTRKTWDTVGEFDEVYRIHHDNDWLGRLGEKKCQRVHLVEATGPVIPAVVAQVRPWLSNVLSEGGPSVRLLRHGLPWPLVLRLVHQGSVMHQIDHDNTAYRDRGLHELGLLQHTYGRIPW